MAGVALTTLQCPKCSKLYITRIVVRQTLSGGRPAILFPGPTCTGKPAIDAEGEACGFDWTTLEVESFDIPLNTKALKIPRG